MIDKILKIGNITEFEDKILARIQRRQLIFGNRLQLAELKVLSLIDNLKNDEDSFLSCYNCEDKITITELTNISGDLYCNNCIGENFTNCNDCGDFVYNEDIHSLENDIYCQECYFKAKQKVYHNHKIKSALLLKLADIISDYDIFGIEFKIDKHLYSIDSYAQGSYRLGSWSANSWVDIGNNKADLIKAIDYNLGDNKNKLSNIFLNDDTEIEL
jgi:hypothetical protein